MTFPKMSARTPGPWHVTDDADDHTIWIEDKDGVTVACLDCRMYETDLENGSFIVTACNAYDADRALIAELTKALRAFVDAAMDDYKLDRAHKQARSALSRVEKSDG